MGISGSGRVYNRTTVGGASPVGCFMTATTFILPETSPKCRVETPLDDSDRLPWLLAMRSHLEAVLAKREHAVLAASLLKQEYRDRVTSGLPAVQLVYLKADPRVIDERLKQRRGHFFQSDLLRSQLDILEEPPEAFVMSVETPSAAIVSRIVDELGLDVRA